MVGFAWVAQDGQAAKSTVVSSIINANANYFYLGAAFLSKIACIRRGVPAEYKCE
jgi:hypothetical protein